jgi:hypothetical protein
MSSIVLLFSVQSSAFAKDFLDGLFYVLKVCCMNYKWTISPNRFSIFRPHRIGFQFAVPSVREFRKVIQQAKGFGSYPLLQQKFEDFGVILAITDKQFYP